MIQWVEYRQKQTAAPEQCEDYGGGVHASCLGEVVVVGGDSKYVVWYWSILSTQTTPSHTSKVLFVDYEASAMHFFVDTAAWKFFWLQFQWASRQSIWTMLFRRSPFSCWVDWQNLLVWCCLWFYWVRCAVLIPKLVLGQLYVPWISSCRQQRDSIGKIVPTLDAAPSAGFKIVSDWL